jgi:hypothetical protein
MKVMTQTQDIDTPRTFVIEFENGKPLGTDVFEHISPYDMFYELMGDLDKKYPDQVEGNEAGEECYFIVVRGQVKFIISQK